MERKSITISYLELQRGQNHRGMTIDIEGLPIERLTIPCPAFNYFMYRALFWVDKLNWSKKSGKTLYSATTCRPGVPPCGYFELEQSETETTEIAYLGILKQFSGCGLGKKLLLEALAIAGKEGQKFNSQPAASTTQPLANYLARGMTIYREETIQRFLPKLAPAFWPG